MSDYSVKRKGSRLFLVERQCPDRAPGERARAIPCLISTLPLGSSTSLCSHRIHRVHRFSVESIAAATGTAIRPGVAYHVCEAMGRFVRRNG